VAGKQFIIDPDELDFENIAYGIDEVRRYNPQRGSMEHLSGIVYDNPETNTCVGYLDVSEEAFWCAGHMPEMPLMPGVIMCEAAAQVCSFHSQKHDLLGCEAMGLGGLDDIRFRGVVVPGDRLSIACQLTQLRRGRMVVSRFQGFVGRNIVCEGGIRGIPLPSASLHDLKTA
jgi:3-hydroxyacyl-[acyl-carrier-protein] dehydratase